jgi:hypothetical protein
LTTDQPAQPPEPIHQEDNTLTSTILTKKGTEMNLLHEDLARAHMDARLHEARELRRSYQLSRAQRLARKAERASQQSRLALARML